MISFERSEKIISICDEVLDIKSKSIKDTLSNNYKGLRSTPVNTKCIDGYDLLFDVFKEIEKYAKGKSDEHLNYSIMSSLINMYGRVNVILKDDVCIYYSDKGSWIEVDGIENTIKPCKGMVDDITINLAYMIEVSGLNAILDVFPKIEIPNPDKAYRYILGKISDMNPDNRSEIDMLKYIGTIILYYGDINTKEE